MSSTGYTSAIDRFIEVVANDVANPIFVTGDAARFGEFDDARSVEGVSVYTSDSTSRSNNAWITDCGRARRVPLCGVAVEAADMWIDANAFTPPWQPLFGWLAD